MEKSASLEATVGPLQTECALAVQKIASMDLDLKAAQETVAGVEEELETTKRSMSRTKELEERSRSQKELTLISQLEEADAITGILKSKLAVHTPPSRSALASCITSEISAQQRAVHGGTRTVTARDAGDGGAGQGRGAEQRRAASAGQL